MYCECLCVFTDILMGLLGFVVTFLSMSSKRLERNHEGMTLHVLEQLLTHISQHGNIAIDVLSSSSLAHASRHDQSTISRVAGTTNVVTIGTSTMYIYCRTHDHHTHSIEDILRNSNTRATKYPSRPCAERVTPCGPQRDGLKQWCVRSEALLWQSTQVDTPTSLMPKEPRGGLTKDSRVFFWRGNVCACDQQREPLEGQTREEARRLLFFASLQVKG